MKAHKDQLQEQRKAHLAHLEECMREGIRVCFNCSFDENMQDKEIRSLAKQLFLSYHFVKKSTDVKVQIHLASFAEGSPCRVACEQLFSGASWLELLDVDSSKTFVIGGLVDRTVTKTFLPGKSRVVLNINSVLEALVVFSRNKDWTEALTAVLPVRMQKLSRLDASFAAAQLARKQREAAWCRGRARRIAKVDGIDESEPEPFEEGYGLEALESIATESSPSCPSLSSSTFPSFSEDSGPAVHEGFNPLLA
ncbi:tRNA (guanine-n1)-methyltransferase domain-containing protein [Cyclospora cayetanensis]|uniref:tRNA (Guanine-n1)-methyltransferase domain-containing protein n=1 Tax=Cyclospora cayetanensis TaxID=88456 RepID=A0A1D3CZS7_9EIME|nr:tRNA (guanine-n1)-methyltransferase domain-containing protein [Cyclospora cayetanensis]